MGSGALLTVQYCTKIIISFFVTEEQSRLYTLRIYFHYKLPEMVISAQYLWVFLAWLYDCLTTQFLATTPVYNNCIKREGRELFIGPRTSVGPETAQLLP